MVDNSWWKYVPIIVIIIFVIVIVIVFIFGPSTYHPRKTGRWSDIQHSTCTNTSGDCKEPGTREVYRDCISNSDSEHGCIDESGNHVYGKEILRIEPCFPLCVSSQWSNSSANQGCQVFSDKKGTILAPDQSCIDQGEYAYVKSTRTCLAGQNEGTNYCLREDGSRAPIGSVEIVLSGCDTIPHCKIGEWTRCPDNPRTDLVPIQTVPGAPCGNIVQIDDVSECRVFDSDNNTWIVSSEDNCIASEKIECIKYAFNWPCSPLPGIYPSYIEEEKLELAPNGDTIRPAYDANQQILVDQGSVVTTPILIAPSIDFSQQPVYFYFVQSNMYPLAGYLLASVEGETGIKIVRYDGVNLYMDHLPQYMSLSDSFDQEGGRTLFSWSATLGFTFWELNHFVPPASNFPIFCFPAPPCITITSYPL